MPFDGLLRQRGHSRGNLAVNRNVSNPDFLHRRDKRARLARMTVEKAFARERRDVLHNRSLAGEAEMLLNFARAGRHSFLALLDLDEFQDASFPFGEHALSWPPQARLQVQMNTVLFGAQPLTAMITGIVFLPTDRSSAKDRQF